LAETSELYQFEIFVNSVVVLSETVVQPKRILSNSELLQIYPTGIPEILDISVAQISPEVGAGAVNRQMLSI